MRATCWIDPTAEIGPGTELGAFVVIGAGVRIGRNCRIGHHVVVHAGVRIGDGVRIDEHAVIGKQPMRAARSAVTRAEEQPPAEIGDGCLIGAHAIIYAGARLEAGVMVADLATVRERVQVGAGTIIGRGVAVENDCLIGRYCKLETNAYITAYSRLEDFVFVAPCVATSNDPFAGRTAERFRRFRGVTVRRGGRIGVHATILPGIEIGEDALVGAGAVLTRHAQPGLIYKGVPARPAGPVPQEQRLENQGWTE
ncbi:MAG: DapH/DapD/GlmU-related protein [Bacteroidota bacterium]|nr:N-acetyltransferase [Rhodothermia bacterium]MCS7155676.1 N-acetyltransferase [Bacteroidota bacterium]MDW8137184.1 DapH/DapD/GlmU-related protein [Bacteroidota bacterium]MDW8284946.1 DapH/DapD/GlmU-related protein [Bacteroidota bacterium]